VACGCGEGYYHGIITVEREGMVALVVKRGKVCQLRFLDHLAIKDIEAIWDI
jgi:hypothetical protein